MGKAPQSVTIPHQLESLQKMVGGYLESFHLFDDVVLICNEEGKLLDLPANRLVCPDGLRAEVICGDFFVTACADSDFVDLSADQLSRTLSMLEGTNATGYADGHIADDCSEANVS